MSFYAENIKYLSPELINKIEKIKIFRQLSSLSTKNNQLTLKIYEGEKYIYLHSLYNPEKEAERFVLNEYDEKSDEFLVIGFGLGYHIKQLLKKLSNNQKLKVIVVNNDIFKFALENIKLSAILKNKKLEILCEPESDEFIYSLQNILNKNKTGKKLIVHPQSMKIIPKELLFFKNILEEIKISHYNSKRLNPIICSNINKNINYLSDCTGVNEFKGSFKNKPIIIVSAGPSLDKNIDQLQKVKNTALIITVDTAFPILYKHGIKPDLIVSIEPIDTIYDKIFRNYRNLDLPLLFTLGTSSKLLRNYFGPKIIGLADGDLLMDEINNHINKGRLATGGSVAIAALDFAYKIGGSPIILVGQDFAYAKDGLTHASESFYGNERVDTINLREVESVNGDTVYTSTNLYLYLRQFEKYISRNSGIYIDATEGGAKIKGTKIMTLPETLEEKCVSEIEKNIFFKKLHNNRLKKKNDLQIIRGIINNF